MRGSGGEGEGGGVGGGGGGWGGSGTFCARPSRTPPGPPATQKSDLQRRLGTHLSKSNQKWCQTDPLWTLISRLFCESGINFHFFTRSPKSLLNDPKMTSIWGPAGLTIPTLGGLGGTLGLLMDAKNPTYSPNEFDPRPNEIDPRLNEIDPRPNSSKKLPHGGQQAPKSVPK